MHSLGARRLVRPPACLARKITEVKEEEGGARKGGEEGRGEGEEEKERVKGIGEEGRREGEEKEEGRGEGEEEGRGEVEWRMGDILLRARAEYARICIYKMCGGSVCAYVIFLHERGMNGQATTII